MMPIRGNLPAFAAAVAFANALLLTSVAHALETEPRNLSFEDSTEVMGGRPPGWEYLQHGGKPSFEFVIDDQVAKDGKHSLRIKRTGTEPYCLVSQTIKADRFRGKRVRLTAFVRLDNVESFGRGASGVYLLLKSDGGGSRSFDDMRDRPLRGTKPWTEVNVEIDVPSAAAIIELGAGLTGSGTLWVDAFKLEVVTPDANSAQTAK
jgi:hypothetical protein